MKEIYSVVKGARGRKLKPNFRAIFSKLSAASL